MGKQLLCPFLIEAFAFIPCQGSCSVQYMMGEELKGPVTQHCGDPISLMRGPTFKLFSVSGVVILPALQSRATHTFLSANLHGLCFFFQFAPADSQKKIYSFSGPFRHRCSFSSSQTPFRSRCFTVVAPSANLSTHFVIICANYHWRA